MTHRTSFLLGFLFSLMLLPSILKAQDCDTLNNTLAGDTISIFPTDTGYLSGHNEFGDIAKAERFNGTGTVTGIALAFFTAKFATTSSTIQVRVWDNDGTNGAPATVLATENITIKSVADSITAGTNVFFVNFTTPPVVDGIFYAGISFTYAAGDTIALLTTNALSRPGTGWEQWSNGSWHAYSDTLGWGIELTNFILASVCGSVGVETVDGNNITVTTAPNPFSDHTTISVEGITGSYDFQLFDATGKVVRELRAIDTPRFTLIRDNMPAGMYLYTVSTKKGMVKGSVVVK